MIAVAIYSTDAWNSYSSMSHLGTFTNSREYKKALRELYKSEYFETECKISEFVNLSVNEQNNQSTYLYLEELTFNELLI